MKKQGFTLIELMVVIVIMGILAAVAVPKLFGMIAKSKASEIGPAAGEYIKLQDAYVSESNAAGDWKLIGYKMEDNVNFTYTGNKTGGTTAVSSLNDLLGWKATNNVAMNDCGANGGCEWNLKMAEGNDGNGVEYKAYEASDAAALTPSFCKIGGKSTCDGSASGS